jgi:uncharacterized membrane protein YqaE (UPF0057 family)
MRFALFLFFLIISFSLKASYSPSLSLSSSTGQIIAGSEEGKQSYKAKSLLRKFWRKVQDVDNDLAFLVILSVLLPFLAVYLKEGKVNSRFWISLLLTALFWLPGVIYSLLVVLNKD